MEFKITFSVSSDENMEYIKIKTQECEIILAHRHFLFSAENDVSFPDIE